MLLLKVFVIWTNIVTSEMPVNYKKDNEIITEKKWFLESDGVNLHDLFNSEFVDFRNTISNDIIEIYDILGIEAARSALIEEITGVIDEYVNDIRHIEICDVMTNKGYLTAINRQGISRGDVGPYAKCSFEDTTDQLMKAALFGERDRLQGVSSNIMMGQPIKAGTGMCEMALDEEQFNKQLQSISLSKEEFVDVDHKNIDSLLDTKQDTDYLVLILTLSFLFEAKVDYNF